VLILGRRPGESIVIDGGIRIIVISSDRRGVRLGIEAPSHVGIVRGEIVAQIADETRRATAPAESEWLAALAAVSRGGAGSATEDDADDADDEDDEDGEDDAVSRTAGEAAD
jgi:carbon storage regulator